MSSCGIVISSRGIVIVWHRIVWHRQRLAWHRHRIASYSRLVLEHRIDSPGCGKRMSSHRIASPGRGPVLNRIASLHFESMPNESNGNLAVPKVPKCTGTAFEHSTTTANYIPNFFPRLLHPRLVTMGMNQGPETNGSRFKTTGAETCPKLADKVPDFYNVGTQAHALKKQRRLTPNSPCRVHKNIPAQSFQQ